MEVLARIAHAIDKQGLAIRLKFSKEGIAGDEPRPCLQVQQRFRRASRSWIKSNDTFVWRAVNEERKPDRDAEGLPIGIGHAEILELPHGFRHLAIPVVVAIAEQRGARPADTEQTALGGFDQMAMIGGDRSRA